MRSIIIVDDEKLVRVGLRTIMDWQAYGYEVIGVYSNGLEAWDAIGKRAPDVLFTDIRMPKMDGLELINKIKQAELPIHVVILSSYEDFEYTRKAIQLNVQDYLIKHELETEEIVQVLNRLTFTDDTKSKTKTSPLTSEKEVFLSWVQDRNGDLDELTDWNEESFPLLFEHVTNIHPNTQYAWVVFHLLPKKEWYLDPEMKALAALMDETLSRLKSVFLGSHNGRYSALLCLNKQSQQDIKQQALKIVEEVVHTSYDNLNVELYCGISSITPSLENVPLLHAEAEQAVQSYFFHGSGIYVYDQATSQNSFSESEWIALFQKAKDFIEAQSYDALFRWLEQQFHTLPHHVQPREAIRFCEMVINNFVHYILDRYQMDLGYQGSNSDLENELYALRTASSWQDVQEMTYSIIRKGQEAIEHKRFKKGWIAETIEFIESNYDKPIRLEDVAGHVNFSVNYFSQRFHQELGVLFTEYLMKYRINKAKEYFLQGTESTEEIAYKVGYTNTNYFTRVFKKVTGTTISEFKRNI